MSFLVILYKYGTLTLTFTKYIYFKLLVEQLTSYQLIIEITSGSQLIVIKITNC